MPRKRRRYNKFAEKNRTRNYRPPFDTGCPFASVGGPALFPPKWVMPECRSPFAFLSEVDGFLRVSLHILVSHAVRIALPPRLSADGELALTASKMCQDLCVGYAYSGTQLAENCWCGDASTDVNRHGPSQDCDEPCTGNEVGVDLIEPYRWCTCPASGVSVADGVGLEIRSEQTSCSI